MSIYFMHGKTFLNKFVKEDPRIVSKVQFVVVSNTIRKNGKRQKQIMNATQMLYPSQDLILDYDDYTDIHYENAYREILESHKALLATIISFAIEEDQTVVFLCGQREKKYRYFEMLQEYVEHEFEYHIYDYKKYKKGKEKEKKQDLTWTLVLCDDALKEEKKEQKRRAMSTEVGRQKYFSSLSKKELKKELKKLDLYTKGESKKEMIRDLVHFY